MTQVFAQLHADFSSRAAAVTAIANGFVPKDGTTYNIGGIAYLGQTGATDIADLPGLVPVNKTPQHYGAVGDGVTDDRAAFAAADAGGTLVTITKPPVGYTFSSALTMSSPLSIDPHITWNQLTDGGNLSFVGSHYESGGANIWRFTDRVFVGEAAAHYAGGPGPDAGNSWLDGPADGPHYLLSNATLISMPQDRRYGIVGAASTGIGSGAGSAIGIGAIAINDATGANAAPAWAFITEVQHETADAKTWGIEIALKNASGAGTTLNPYSAGPTNMTTGLLLAGGGDNSFGPSATHPCTAGIVFSTSNSTGWNSGIVFRGSSIPTGDAIQMPYNYRMAWYDSTGTKSAEISATNNTPGTFVRMNMGANNFNFSNDAGNSAFYIATGPTHVNRIQVTSNTTGNAPYISADGSDTNLDLRLIPKGTGRVRFGTHTATGDTAISGYIEIRDNGGTVRKLAVIT